MDECAWPSGAVLEADRCGGRMRRVRVAVAVLSLGTVPSCDDGTGPNVNDVPGYVISSVRVSPSTATIFIPDTVRVSDQVTFSAMAIGKSGVPLTGIRFVWRRPTRRSRLSIP